MDQSTEVAAAAESPLQGIGGWLLLFTVLVFLGIAFGLLAFTGVAYVLTKVQGMAVFWGLLIVAGVSVFFGILKVVVLFQKRKSGPKIIVGLLGISIVLQIVSIILTASLPSVAVAQQGGHNIGSSAVSIAINVAWIAYFKTSKRVQNTFVN